MAFWISLYNSGLYDSSDFVNCLRLKFTHGSNRRGVRRNDSIYMCCDWITRTCEGDGGGQHVPVAHYRCLSSCPLYALRMIVWTPMPSMSINIVFFLDPSMSFVFVSIFLFLFSFPIVAVLFLIPLYHHNIIQLLTEFSPFVRAIILHILLYVVHECTFQCESKVNNTDL